MRLFLDANIMTYIAFFEGYLCEGTSEELEASISSWTDLQGAVPDECLLREVEALRLLYWLDEQARFDWLFSDLAIEEVMRIRSALKRRLHYDLLDRLIEHRYDVCLEEGRSFTTQDRETLLSSLFPGLQGNMTVDALQYCEAVLIEADYFLTNDIAFVNTATMAEASVSPSRVSDLPFIAEVSEKRARHGHFTGGGILQTQGGRANE